MAAHRWIARLAVAALHIALFALLWLHRPAPPQPPAERRLTAVRLLQPRQRPTPPAPPAVNAPRLAAPEQPLPAPPA
ncbi:MAG: DUF3108 domain-containing protein, partial [Comamonadaceae bacterium]|nr:DUF3108 domain-containing protein [Comamonadaceae bacterium]